MPISEVFRGQALQTTSGRVLLAGAAGSAMGAILYLVGAAVATGMSGLASAWETPLLTVVLAAIAFSYATTIWAAGLGIFGAPVWWALHRLGFRGWPIAALVGAVMPGAVMFVLVAFMVDAPRGVLFGGLFGGAGAIVALTVWRIAYRRTPA